MNNLKNLFIEKQTRTGKEFFKEWITEIYHVFVDVDKNDASKLVIGLEIRYFNEITEQFQKDQGVFWNGLTPAEFLELLERLTIEEKIPFLIGGEII